MIYKHIAKIKKTHAFDYVIYIRYLISRYLVSRQYANHYSQDSINAISVSDRKITFFGYYNLCPENIIGDLLFLTVNSEKSVGSSSNKAKIILGSSNGSETVVCETASWNWQQGCMLQWMPNETEYFIYNDYAKDDDCYISIVSDLNGSNQSVYKRPICCITSDGKYALSLNFTRLALMRPCYGYFNKKNVTLPSDDSDGIWKIDLNSGNSKLIVSLSSLRDLCKSETMEGSRHKVNHIDISPGDDRFMFLHRWIGPRGRYTRLITCSMNGSDLRILNGDVMTSHCCWLDCNRILAYCTKGEKTGYFVFRDENTDTVSLYLPEKHSSSDGHPSISPEHGYIALDTYPDRARFSSLLLFNISTGSVDTLGKYFQPFRYRRDNRIDLHPKWGRTQNRLFFESGHDGNRKLYSVSLDNYE